MHDREDRSHRYVDHDKKEAPRHILNTGLIELDIEIEKSDYERNEHGRTYSRLRGDWIPFHLDEGPLHQKFHLQAHWG